MTALCDGHRLFRQHGHRGRYHLNRSSSQETDLHQLNGSSDAFIAVVPFTGAQDLVSSTYFRGSGDDEIRSIVAQRKGTSGTHLYFAGTTSSTDLPLANASQAQHGGGESDAFAGQLDLEQGSLIFNTYIGGSGRDDAAAIALA